MKLINEVGWWLKLTLVWNLSDECRYQLEKLQEKKNCVDPTHLEWWLRKVSSL